MNATADRSQFAPPETGGHGRALVLAVLAHLVLVGALTLGVQWKRDAPSITVQAELWSAVPKAAAPRLVEAPPAPRAPPRPAPPAPVTSKVAKAPDADIALEREKQRLQREKLLAARRLEQERLDKARAEKRKLEQGQRELAQRDKEKAALEKKREQELKLAQERQKREEDKKRLAEEARREQARKADEARQKAIRQAQLDKEEAIKLERMRNDNLQRIAGLAGATGSATASGSAQRSSGPSGTYAGRVSASVKPNIVFTEDPADNPTALVEVRAAPDGTIVGRKLLKSSGNKAWDEAVLRAIDKTAQLPRDVDGTVPALLEISFRRRD